MVKSAIHVDKSSLVRVTRNMNAAVLGLKIKSKRGFIAAGIHLLGKALDKTPKEFGNLQASGTVIWNKSSQPSGVQFRGEKGPEVRNDTNNLIATEKTTIKDDVGVGFGASYSLFVHENMTAKHPRGGESKFLEKALAEEQSDILKIISEYAKV